MPRKQPRLSPLEMRKSLLVAESELNRAQLKDEWDAATEWHRTLGVWAKTAGSVASVVVALVSGVRGFRRKRNAKSGAESSRLQPVNRGMGLISSTGRSSTSRVATRRANGTLQEKTNL